MGCPPILAVAAVCEYRIPFYCQTRYALSIPTTGGRHSANENVLGFGLSCIAHSENNLRIAC